MGTLYLGGPVWSCSAWVGSFYRKGSTSDSYLEQYASVFNAVEASSTFYALPAAVHVERWAQSVPKGFALCFKVPRRISHEGRLDQRDSEVDMFLQRVDHAGDRLGPLFLQLPPTRGPATLESLNNLLNRLRTQRGPRWSDHPFAVEVRHPAFFEASASRELDDVLRQNRVDRVHMDARSIHAVVSPDEATRTELQQKPLLPFTDQVTAGRPFLRLILGNETSVGDGIVDERVKSIATWLVQGHSPHVFVHTPDEARVPRVARLVYEALQKEVPSLPRLSEAPAASDPLQLGLF